MNSLTPQRTPSPLGPHASPASPAPSAEAAAQTPVTTGVRGELAEAAPAVPIPLHSRSVLAASDPGREADPLPPELLAIVIASACDTLEEARAMVRQLIPQPREAKPDAPPSAVEVRLMSLMMKESPALVRDDLLQKFSPAGVETILGAIKGLRDQALALGHPTEDVDDWAFSSRTVYQLFSKSPEWFHGPLGTTYITDEPIALLYASTSGGLAKVPTEHRSDRVCRAAVEHPDWLPQTLHEVPPVRRTSALLEAVVTRNPRAFEMLDERERTLNLYEAIVSQVDLATFRSLPVSAEMAATAGYQALLTRLAQPGDAKK